MIGIVLLPPLGGQERMGAVVGAVFHTEYGTRDLQFRDVTGADQAGVKSSRSLWTGRWRQNGAGSESGASGVGWRRLPVAVAWTMRMCWR